MGRRNSHDWDLADLIENYNEKRWSHFATTFSVITKRGELIFQLARIKYFLK